MTQQIKTPAERTAGAYACVKDTESKVAFHVLNSTIVESNKIKTSAWKQPEAEAKFTDTLFSRGVSVRAGSTHSVSGATITNAWLPARLYRVDAFLCVEVLT